MAKSNVAGQAASGAASGAVSGAMTGAKLAGMVGGVGAPIGAIAGAVVGGVGSGIKAGRKAKAAEQADASIQAQDPQELARLAEINRIRKSIGAGTDPLTQQSIRQAQQTGAATQERIARSTGGDIGATITGLTRAQRGTQAATNQALAAAQQRLPFFENMGQQLMTRVSQRALEIGLMRRDQAMAEKAANAKASSANLAGAIGALGNMQAQPNPAASPVTGSTDPVADGVDPVTGDKNIPAIVEAWQLGTQSGYTEPNAVNLGQPVPSIVPSPGSPVKTGFGNLTGGTGISSNKPSNIIEKIFGSGGVPSIAGNGDAKMNLLDKAKPAIGAIKTAMGNISNLGNAPL